LKTKAIALPRGPLKLVALPGKGRGVIATRRIAHGTLIEAAPVIRMRKADRPARSSILSHYPFAWNEPPYVEAFALGFAALLNHSKTPNCWLEVDVAAEVIRVWADDDIARGTELTYDYGVEPWFDLAT
jgi:SET domain-containing protein